VYHILTRRDDADPPNNPNRPLRNQQTHNNNNNSNNNNNTSPTTPTTTNLTNRRDENQAGRTAKDQHEPNTFANSNNKLNSNVTKTSLSLSNSSNTITTTATATTTATTTTTTTTISADNTNMEPSAPIQPTTNKKIEPIVILTKEEYISKLICDLLLITLKEPKEDSEEAIVSNELFYFRQANEEGNLITLVDISLIDFILMEYSEKMKSSPTTIAFIFYTKLYHRAFHFHKFSSTINQEILSKDEQKEISLACRRSLISFAGLNLMDWSENIYQVFLFSLISFSPDKYKHTMKNLIT
jgi:hypothetical protein